MKTFIDNTCLHRIWKVINAKKIPSSIHGIDALALFDFAEHILFAECIELNGFEVPAIRERSAETIDFLYSRGWIVGGGGESILNLVKFTEEQYANACETAAPKIFEELMVLDAKKLNGCSTLVTEAARPIGITSAPIEKWISPTLINLDRLRIKEEALSDKAMGAFDYVISTNDALFEQLNLLRPLVKKNYRRISLILGILFRTTINQSLASKRKAYYCPAPQRAKIIHNIDRLFRHSLSHEIQQIVSSIEQDNLTKLFTLFDTEEELPLPVFALHFLRERGIKSPFEMLDAARQLRDHPDVKNVRKWLNQWEVSCHSLNLNDRQKAKNELNYITRHLQISLQEGYSLSSLLRIDVSVNADGGVKIKPDTAKISAEIYTLLRRYSRRSIFLSTLAKELAYDDNLVSDVITMLNRAIIK